ncbi:hypothetical protein PR048_020520 [Dryococelus australis]|uniref:Uncharacterized protein n=1 Tax=Dryococelus australis TaxID=614101 RepID=A0ABQ9H6H5_9NEOP|nr:hypothetical protein PR048_020520 [Dryococelus australis]
MFCIAVSSLPRGEHVLNFSDAEELINDAELVDPPEEKLELELAISDRLVILLHCVTVPLYLGQFSSSYLRWPDSVQLGCVS